MEKVRRIEATDCSVGPRDIRLRLLKMPGCFRGAGGGGIKVENSVVYFNSADSSGSNVYSTGTGHEYNYNCVAPTNSLPGSNNIPLNPLFVDGANDNYRLQRGSPGVNTGVNRDWMPGTFDLDGHHRPDKFTGIVDIGCYEHVFRGSMFKTR